MHKQNTHLIDKLKSTDIKDYSLLEGKELMNNLLSLLTGSEQSTCNTAYTELKKMQSHIINLSSQLEKMMIRQGDYRQFSYFKNLVRMTVEQAQQMDINENSKVLFIGSGAYPISALTVHELAECTVYCLDRDTEAVELSRELFCKKDLSNIYASSKTEDIPLNEITHLFIASQVKEKTSILNMISDKTQQNITSVVRMGKENKRILGYDFSLKNIKDWAVVDLVDDVKDTHAYYILKK